MTNLDKVVLTPGANVTHAYNNVSITLSGIGADFTLVPDPLPDGNPPTGHPGALQSFFRKRSDNTPAAGTGQRIYWLVGFHLNKKDTSKTPSFNVELPEVAGRNETSFYYLENGRLIFLGKTVKNGGPVTVPLTLDDPSVGMT
jgi:hypothetical protein